MLCFDTGSHAYTDRRAALAEQRARTGVTELGLTGPFRIADAVAAVENRIGRPITVVPVAHPLPAGVNGLWLHTDSSEIVIHHRDDTPARSAVIVAHELGHILLKHPPVSMVAALQVTRGGAAGGRTSRVVHGRGRESVADGYASVEELEAEMFARLAVTGNASEGRDRAGPLGRFLDTF